MERISASIAGQQPCLFLGPLFVFYKSLYVIETANNIQKKTNSSCTPVFWIQAEDHDTKEMNHTFIPQSNGEPLKIELTEAASRSSIRYQKLGGSVVPAFNKLKTELERFDYSSEILSILEKHYNPENNYVAAFKGAMEDIFGEDGLILFDSRDEKIAPHLSEIYKTALIRSAEIEELLQQRVKEINLTGQQEQVPLRDGLALLCYHLKSKDGPRYRIKKNGNNWETQGANESISLTEALELTEKDPFRFSSTALLRPIVQDLLFSTQAFIGGKAEIAYMNQITPLYDLFSIKQPPLLTRPSFTLVEEKILKISKELSLEYKDLYLSKIELIKKLQNSTQNEQNSPEQLKDLLAQKNSILLDAMNEAASSFGIALKDPLKKTKDNIDFLIQKFVDKYAIALATQSGNLSQKVDRVLSSLLPNGIMQERCFGLPYFAAKYGLKNLKEIIRNNIKNLSENNAGGNKFIEL